MKSSVDKNSNRNKLETSLSSLWDARVAFETGQPVSAAHHDIALEFRLRLDESLRL